ncbi:MAG: MBL fold metallo-hydrolase [Saprospiraceae bacterium]
MTLVANFSFNPFQENTYILYDDTKECIIIDPGCYTAAERTQLKEFITEAGLKPVRLINTHCHIDHVFGNKFVADTYGLTLEIHQGELVVLEAMEMVCRQYGIPDIQISPAPGKYLAAGDEIKFGNSSLKALYTPGHSPASLSFYCEESNFVIAGDVLFQNSIGRTDLPGGDMNTLLTSIRQQLFPLPDDVRVYPGHGPATTIGYEKANNPFLS